MDKPNSQLTSEQVEELTKQGYRMVGSHSAVKICSWTKNMIRGEGECYKYKFYGIRSHQCLQMTTSLFCANRCVFCWRGDKAPVSKEWYGEINDPKFIIDGSLEKQKDLLLGFKGAPIVDLEAYKQSGNVKHVALSLIGESIVYPKINELINDFHKRRISTFVVTNGQFPEHIKKLDRVTQLYLSVDAADAETLKKIGAPLFSDYWDRLLSSLDELARRKGRTCIRLTVIKGLNDLDTEKYAELIKRGNPDFIEVKGYIHVGASRKFLERENMPNHEELKQLSEKLLKHLPSYEIIDDQESSKVYCLMKKEFNGRYIDFSKFFSGEEEYSSKKMCPNN